jgi:hypothetical protein
MIAFIEYEKPYLFDHWISNRLIDSGGPAAWQLPYQKELKII